jgi:P-aminobenzoate N-oxygenase AurF
MGEALATWYLPEHITHLYYSPVYSTLSLRQRLAYNRLHACYHCEVCAFLEGELPRYYLKAAAAPGISEKLRQAAQALSDSESWHAATFRSLARRISPQSYSSKDEYVFVRRPSGPWIHFRKLLDWPAFRPALLWIALIQEERGTFFAEEILRHSEQLDPHTVDWQRKHLADEADHLDLGEALLPLCWDASPRWMRWLNSRLLRFVLREFMSAPKRTGVRVIEQLAREHPELMPRKSELIDAMRALDRNPRFHESLYSRKIAPKSFALFDRYMEFRDLGDRLLGYTPAVPRGTQP